MDQNVTNLLEDADQIVSRLKNCVVKSGSGINYVNIPEAMEIIQGITSPNVKDLVLINLLTDQFLVSARA